MSILTLKRKTPGHADGAAGAERWIEPQLGPAPQPPRSQVFDSGHRVIVDCAHVKVERLDTHPVLFSKVFKEFEDRKGHKYDYRYWAERENYFLREFLKKQSEFTHVVQARHLISENDAAKQVLTCDAGVTIANWLRVKARYADTATLSHPFQRADVFLRLVRACLVALKELHEHRIVHCDIKEDNICIPYAPYPLPAAGQRVDLGFDRLKLIDFAFSVAHAIPLTQVLVIDPNERLPYQSGLLIAALHADRKSGSPNAVQQLDYRVDLFSLGYMAEKIAASGLVAARGGAEGVVEEIHAYVRRLKDFDAAPVAAGLPHDGLLVELDRLIGRAAAPTATPEFIVDGEWTAEEMAHGRIAGRQTPLTPVALPLPTPVARPVTPAVLAVGGNTRARLGMLAGIVGAFAMAGAFVYQIQSPRPEIKAVAPVAAPVPQATKLSEADRLAAEFGNTLTSSVVYEEKSRAFAKLAELSKEGNAAAARHIAAFETRYDGVKQIVAKSAWWTKGQGAQPGEAAAWMDDQRLLAEHGDRPAMLDLAFATGYGRTLAQDRGGAVAAYLRVIDKSEGADEASKRVRLSAGRGLSAMLNTIVEQKDVASMGRVLPDLERRANAGAADVQYYLGLMSECVAQPADLATAQQWYLKSAEDPVWKATAERKAQLLGKWCPGRR
jgi:hypothetical protein